MTDRPVVSLAAGSAGPLRGVSEGGVHQYRSVRYAAPAKRWCPPEPAQGWAGVHDAADWGPDCPQEPWNGSRAPRLDEGCLTLNIWTLILQSPGSFRPLAALTDSDTAGLAVGPDIDELRALPWPEVLAWTNARPSPLAASTTRQRSLAPPHQARCPLAATRSGLPGRFLPGPGPLG